MNVTLIENARRLAEEESLACEPRVANAFQLEQPGHIYKQLSTLRGRNQEAPGSP